MTLLLFGLAMICLVEGLILALAPGIYEQVVAFLAATPPEQRRVFGLAAVAFGVGLLWLVRELGMSVTLN